MYTVEELINIILCKSEQLEELAKFSPVFDMLTNPTPVSIEIVKE